VVTKDDLNPGKQRLATNKLKVIEQIDDFLNESQLSLQRENGDTYLIRLKKNGQHEMIVLRPTGDGYHQIWSINPDKSDKKVKEWISESKGSRSYGNLPSDYVTLLQKGKSYKEEQSKITPKSSTIKAEIKFQKDDTIDLTDLPPNKFGRLEALKIEEKRLADRLKTLDFQMGEANEYDRVTTSISRASRKSH